MGERLSRLMRKGCKDATTTIKLGKGQRMFLQGCPKEWTGKAIRALIRGQEKPIIVKDGDTSYTVSKREAARLYRG